MHETGTAKAGSGRQAEHLSKAPLNAQRVSSSERCCEKSRLEPFRSCKKITREVTAMENTDKAIKDVLVGSLQEATDEALKGLEKAKQKAAKRETASAGLPKEKLAKRGKRGQGCIYLPKNSRNYWIKFSMNGRVYQETANTESKNQATDFLRTRISEVSSGKFVDCKKVTVQILKDDMTKAWELAQKNEATQEWAARCWKRLLPFFGKMKASDALASAAIMEYQAQRREKGAANATINRELAVLSCAFTLAYESTPRRVPEKLHFTRLPEPKGRQGFVEKKQYDALAAKCEETYMRAMLALAYN